jgi:hypothetical protein
MSLLERIYTLSPKLKNYHFPNAENPSGRFEHSRATAHHDINYLRDRLLAPLAFDKSSSMAAWRKYWNQTPCKNELLWE